MKITLLGTGTSQGIPVIGCDCAVCSSKDSRDVRLRTSLYIENGNTSILIDTSPDLRQQMLLHTISDIDAVIYTHEHNDHTAGFDDIRPFCFKNKKDMPIYGLKRVMDDMKNRFAYAFSDISYPGVPRAITNNIKPGDSFKIGNIDILGIPVIHGNLDILGFRINNFAFITDASKLTDFAFKLLDGVEVLVINALQRNSHHSHFTLSQSLESIEKINPSQAYISHLSHKMGMTNNWEKELPENVLPSFDGLVVYG
ncbi:MAG: MBL fold metallo-hydrolase [Saprospiraceae bacterium]